jgi:CheY-like chemotaxis protein
MAKEPAARQTANILIAEDEKALRRLTTDICSGVGHRVKEAADGAQAIEQLKAERPDVVLLDIKMPNVDGWGVLDYVRTMEDPPPVILVTGVAEVVPPGDLNAYVAGIVTKPFAVTQLLKTIELALSRPPRLRSPEARKEPRRTFVVQTTLLSEAGQPLAIGHIEELSPRGFRLDISIRVQEGDSIRVAFQIPGREQSVDLKGRVKWRDAGTLGAEIEDVSEADAALLRQLLHD